MDDQANLSGLGVPGPDVLDALLKVVGPTGFIDQEPDKAPYLKDERELFEGRSPAVLRPATTEEVAQCLSICTSHGVGVVPQGGNTGYCGGAVPSDNQILLNLGRLNKIREIDPVNSTMTVEAGCILKDIQDKASDQGLLFPLSLAAEGSCQIGGNLATNAGGVQVLRYGNARDLVLGLEVVTADGEVWQGLRGLRKDNTGYDLKHLFMGSEGTLGIITAAVLKLFPQPASRVVALLAAKSPECLLKVLPSLRAATSDAVTSFEYMHRSCLELVFAQVDGARDPLDTPHDHYALIEISSGEASTSLRETVEDCLAGGFEEGLIDDAVLAESDTQAAALWDLRETIPEAQKRHGGCIKHDVSVPLSALPEFLASATAFSRGVVDDLIVAPFGHFGDGNIHFNLCQPKSMDRQAFLDQAEVICPAIHDIAMALGGSFSAEHGIGILKRDELARYKSDVELDLMRSVKRALDPKGILNPGKII